MNIPNHIKQKIEEYAKKYVPNRDKNSWDLSMLSNRDIADLIEEAAEYGYSLSSGTEGKVLDWNEMWIQFNKEDLDTLVTFTEWLMNNGVQLIQPSV
jgi:hypothetical protein